MNKRNLALGIGGAIGAAVVVKMLTRAKTVDWEKVSDRVFHSENSQFAEVDGMTIHFQEFGDSSDPTVLLIHGYTASTFVWHRVAPKLAEQGFHIIAPDLVGFGYSEKPAWFDYSIASQARMIVRLMNILGIGRATVVGSSYGGAVASTVALDYSERVEKLVLVDAVCNDDILDHPLLKLAAMPGVGEIFTSFFLDSKAFHKMRMKNTLAPANHHLITKDRVESVHRPLAARDAHHAVLATSRSWDACRIQDDAQYINQPTLIIWGDQDKVIPIENGERLFNSILNSRFVVFKDCGHVPPEENPELFIDLVSEFCRDRKGRIENHNDENLKLVN
jgi:pimeloyl-ACP methyl ester carboxylesterase